MATTVPPAEYDRALGIDSPGFFAGKGAELDFLPEEELELKRQRERDNDWPFEIPRKHRGTRRHAGGAQLPSNDMTATTTTEEAA